MWSKFRGWFSLVVLISFLWNPIFLKLWRQKLEETENVFVCPLVISVAIPDVLFRNTKTNYRLKTDSVNYGILSRQGGEKQYILVPLQRLVAVVRQYVLHYSVRNSSLMLLFCYVCINFFAAITHVYLSYREFMALACLECHGKQQQTHKGIQLLGFWKEIHVLLHMLYLCAYFRTAIRIWDHSNWMLVLLFSKSCFIFYILS